MEEITVNFEFNLVVLVGFGWFTFPLFIHSHFCDFISASFFLFKIILHFS